MNDPLPNNSDTQRYVLTNTDYDVLSLSICANVSSPEVITGETTQGIYQYAALKLDTYTIETREWIDYWEDYGIDPETGQEVLLDSGGGYYTPWSSTGTYERRTTVNLPYTITASIGTTSLSTTSGSASQGRRNFTWSSNVTSSTANNFAITVTAPNGKSWTATDSVTVFLKRAVQVEPITMIADQVHGLNKQIAFVRVTNLRDVGEETVTLRYYMGNTLLKTETLLLPSGPAGASKSVLRAFEFTPTSPNITLRVTANAPAISGFSPEQQRTLSASRTRDLSVIGPYSKAQVPGLTNRTSATLPITYHYSTSATAQSYANSIMPQVPYNIYAWAQRTENYTESLNMNVEIDSWQSTPGKGRGTWEIMPLFGNQAHRTVRAGTGFEVAVTTSYSTDFDSRAPVNHRGDSMRLNVTPEGPRRTFAAFPYANHVKSVHPQDNRNYVIGKIGYPHGEETDLEATTGRPGDHTIKWELPLHSYTGETKTLQARTHLIDKFFPDAYPANYDQAIKNYMLNPDPKISFDDKYIFTVVSEVAGVSNLLAVKQDYVYIFGHIFRDIYTTK